MGRKHKYRFNPIRICAITMVRNDDFFLRKWVEYYGRELGIENLYIYFDGQDQVIPEWCKGATAYTYPKIGGNVVEAEKSRLIFLSNRVDELMTCYDIVIGTDADEFIIPDPALGLSLYDYIVSRNFNTSMSPLGIDVGQNLNEEGVIDPSRPFLSQRRYGVIGTRYTKPSIVNERILWGSGFHRIKGHNFHIAPDLYLFHFGYFDQKIIEARFADKDRAAAGWTNHIAKRSRTIRLVSENKPRDWEKWTRRARRIMTLVRPPYAWNKPAMFNMDVVVRIPDRFKNII